MYTIKTTNGDLSTEISAPSLLDVLRLHRALNPSTEPIRVPSDVDVARAHYDDAKQALRNLKRKR